MKVRPSVKPICDKCKVIRRKLHSGISENPDMTVSERQRMSSAPITNAGYISS